MNGVASVFENAIQIIVQILMSSPPACTRTASAGGVAALSGPVAAMAAPEVAAKPAMDAAQAAAAQLRSLEQNMISPKLLEQLVDGMPSVPAVVVAKASEDPVLQKLTAPIREHKQRGAELFKARDVAGALAAYQAAVVAAGGTAGKISPPRTRLLIWPHAEPLAFACQSNAALCLLQLGRPTEAVAACDAALLMPSAASPSSALLSKVPVRKLQPHVSRLQPHAPRLQPDATGCTQAANQKYPVR